MLQFQTLQIDGVGRQLLHANFKLNYTPCHFLLEYLFIKTLVARPQFVSRHSFSISSKQYQQMALDFDCFALLFRFMFVYKICCHSSNITFYKQYRRKTGFYNFYDFNRSIRYCKTKNYLLFSRLTLFYRATFIVQVSYSIRNQ